MRPVDRLVAYFESLAPGDVSELPRYYADDCYFKDPFNEVRSVREIGEIFARMFQQLDAPRFRVHGRVVEGDEAFLTWDLEFRFRGSASPQRIHGVSHLRFGADGRVTYHRDYWDAAEELYGKLPVLGWLMRWLRRRVG
jgi:ketosteroid isomerase-like protein